MWDWKKSNAALLCSLLLLGTVMLPGCSGKTELQNDPKEPGGSVSGLEERGGIQGASGMNLDYVTVNQLEFIRESGEDKLEGGGTFDWSTLKINGLKDKETEEKINSRIDSIFQELKESGLPPYRGIKALVKEDGLQSISIQVFENWNNNNLLDIRFRKNTYYEGAADDHVYVDDNRTVLFDLCTGEELELNDLFADGTDGVKLLNQLIEERLSQSLGEGEETFGWNGFPNLVLPFRGISEDQKFILSNSGLGLLLDYENPEFDCAMWGQLMNFSFYDLKEQLKLGQDAAAAGDDGEGIFESNKAPDRRLLYNVSANTVKQLERVEIPVEKGCCVGDLTIEYPSSMPEELVDHLLKAKGYDEDTIRAKGTALKPGQNYTYSERLSASQIGRYYELSQYVYESNSAEDYWEVSNSMTFDSRTQKGIELRELFTDGFDYRSFLIRKIEESIQGQKESREENAEFLGKTQSGLDGAPSQRMNDELGQMPEELADRLNFRLGSDYISFFDETMSAGVDVGYGKLYFTIPFSEIGYENLTIF